MVPPEPMLARSGPLPLEPGWALRAEARRVPHARPCRRPVRGAQPSRLEHDPTPSRAGPPRGRRGSRWRARRSPARTAGRTSPASAGGCCRAAVLCRSCSSRSTCSSSTAAASRTCPSASAGAS